MARTIWSSFTAFKMKEPSSRTEAAILVRMPFSRSYAERTQAFSSVVIRIPAVAGMVFLFETQPDIGVTVESRSSVSKIIFISIGKLSSLEREGYFFCGAFSAFAVFLLYGFFPQASFFAPCVSCAEEKEKEKGKRTVVVAVGGVEIVENLFFGFPG